MGFASIFVVHPTTPHPPRILHVGISRIFVVSCPIGGSQRREKPTAKTITSGSWGTRPKTAAAVGGHDQKTQQQGGRKVGAQSKTANSGGVVVSEANTGCVVGVRCGRADFRLNVALNFGRHSG